MRSQGKHGRSKQVLSAFAAVVALGLTGVGGGVALAADADEAGSVAAVLGGAGEPGDQGGVDGGRADDDLVLDGAIGGDGAGGDAGQAVVDPADELDGSVDLVDQGDSEQSGEPGLAGSEGERGLFSTPLVRSLGNESLDVADFCDAGTLPDGVAYDAATGAVVIDLSHWGEQGSGDVLSVENSNNSSGGDACAAKMASVVFEYSVAGEGFTNLAIGDDAFYQFSLSGDIALASVEFPAGLVTLDIGDGAFHQFFLVWEQCACDRRIPSGPGVFRYRERGIPSGAWDGQYCA